MLVCVFGTPTPLTQLVVELVDAFAQETIGDSTRVETKNAEELIAAIGAFAHGTNGVGIALCTSPNPDMLQLCESERIPVFVAAERLDTVAQCIMQTFAVDFMRGVRLAMKAMCSLEPLLQNPDAMRLTPLNTPLDLDEAVNSIAAHLARPCSLVQRSAIVERMVLRCEAVPALRDYVAHDAVEPLTTETHAPVSTEEQALLSVLAGGYDAILTGQGMKNMLWPRSAFARPDASEAGVIALVGPSRCLTYGPYFHLPRGLWRATVEFESAENFSGNRLGADVFNGAFLAVVDLIVPVSGVFEVPLEFEVDEVSAPIEVRLLLRNGAIEGQLLLRSVAIERIRALSPKLRDTRRKFGRIGRAPAELRS